MAKDGVILYAQGWKPILADAVALTLLSYVEFLAFLVILGVPAVADAYSLAATLLAYHRSTEGMDPNPEWQARLEQASDQFRALKQKAAETVDEYRSTARGDASAPDAEPTDTAGPEREEASAQPETTDQETR